MKRFCAALTVIALAACGGGGSLPQGTSSNSHSVLQPSNAHPKTYRLIVLGNGVFPNRINNAGTVVGLDLTTNRPFEYRLGHLTDLPLWPGDTQGNVYDINDHDQIVGQTLDPSAISGAGNPCFGSTCPEAHAVLYDHGRISNLGTIPVAPGDRAPVFNSADVINDSGTIAGESGAVNEGGLVGEVIFSPGPIRPLPNAQFFGSIDEGPQGPVQVNNAGEIVGAGQSIFYPVLLAYPNFIACSPELTIRHNGFDGINNGGDTISGNPQSSSSDWVYCRHGSSQQLQMLPSAINDGGDIVGSASVQDAVFAQGALHKIAEGAAAYRGAASVNGISGRRFGRYFISTDRKIQGYVVSVSADDALLYSKGSYYDLNDLVANHPNLVLQDPRAINNRGEIVGATVTADYQTTGWLLVPQ